MLNRVPENATIVGDSYRVSTGREIQDCQAFGLPIEICDSGRWRGTAIVPAWVHLLWKWYYWQQVKGPTEVTDTPAEWAELSDTDFRATLVRASEDHERRALLRT